MPGTHFQRDESQGRFDRIKSVFILQRAFAQILEKQVSSLSSTLHFVAWNFLFPYLMHPVHSPSLPVLSWEFSI
jgi:hypothetical protein